jgi:hypothetical protein
VNCAAWGDDSGNLILSGSDDSFCKVRWSHLFFHCKAVPYLYVRLYCISALRLSGCAAVIPYCVALRCACVCRACVCLCSPQLWDRRTLGSERRPVGAFVGHTEGLTYIAPKGDGRYFISNSKDQVQNTVLLSLIHVLLLCELLRLFRSLRLSSMDAVCSRSSCGTCAVRTTRTLARSRSWRGAASGTTATSRRWPRRSVRAGAMCMRCC